MAKKKYKSDLNLHSESLQAFGWCIRNGIRVYPKPEGEKYRLIVENGLERIKSPVTYEKTEWADKIWEIYRHYYNESKADSIY